MISKRLKLILLLFLIIFLSKSLFSADPPHDSFSCSNCHGNNAISTKNGGLDISRMCLDCHKPGGFGNPVLAKPANPYGTADSIINRGKGTEHAFFGNDINPMAKAVRPTGDEFYGHNVTGAITCASCHNPHVQNHEEGKFLRVKLGKSDELCLRCHVDMNQKQNGYSHPVNVTLQNKEGFFAYPQFSSLRKVYEKKENNVTCYVCHKVHSGFSKITSMGCEGDGFLGRTDMDEWLCLQCHKKPIHGNSRGEREPVCKDCHSLHNPGDNIKLIKKNINFNGSSREVRYVHNTAPSDFYDSEGHGICQVCHKTTKYFRNYSASLYIVTGTSLHNPDNKICTECHSHGNLINFEAPKAKEKPIFEKDAFKGCSGCHGFPPVLNLLGNGGLVKNEGGTGSINIGAHIKHATEIGYAYSCKTCHAGGMPESPIYDKKIQIGFEMFDGLFKGGVFAGRTSLKNGYLFIGGNAETTITDSSITKCTNIYCHSNANPVDKSTLYKQIGWLDKNITCKDCHGDFGNPDGLSSKHIKHISSSYSYKCEECHSETVLGNTEIKDKRKHVNGLKDVFFKFTGNYGIDKSCSVYCHSDGNGGQPEQEVKWNSSISVSCDSCHRGRLEDFKQMTSAGHNRLVSKNWIRKYPCYYCHDETVDEDGNIKDYSKHINKEKNVKINSKWAIPGRPEPEYIASTKVCNNIYCHSDGTTNPEAVKAFSWNQGRANCDTCHGHPRGTCNNSGCHDGVARAVKTDWKPEDIWKSAVPMYPNEGAGKPRANSHTRHIETNFTCDKCHATTIIGGDCLSCHQNGIPSGSMTEAPHLNANYHVNGRKDVVLKDGGSYNPITKTCSNTTCHTGGSDPQWGGSVNSAVICLSCHGTTGSDVDDFDAFNGNKAKINLTQWATAGHGRRSSDGNYPSGNPPANFPGNPCWYCHDNTVLHKNPENPYRLKLHNQFERRFEKECVYCHMEEKVEECLTCHNSSESLAPQVTSEPVIAKHLNNVYTSGCLNALCHPNDEKTHKTGAGFWNYTLKLQIKKQYLFMGVCLKCHDDDSEGQCATCHPVDDRHKLGYDPGTGFIKPQKAKAAGTHYGYKHFAQGSTKGGKFCWDCHDPHGDSNIYMIHDNVAIETDGIFGKPVQRASVVFTRKQSGSDYARINAPYNGICNVCHSAGSQHYRRDGGDGHQLGRVCTECHNHRFTDSHSSGQQCNVCHLNKPIPRHSSFGLPRDCTKCHNGTIGRRTNVMAQLKGNSHHIQNVNVTNRHCYACHWEATPEGIVNNEYHEGYNTKTHVSKKDAKVDLVIWGPGIRPTTYKLYSSATVFLAISSIGTPKEREQVGNISKHCLGCHSDKNNDTQPFNDCKTPRQYAWDKSSIESRFKNLETTKWGKYNTSGAAKKDVTKALSAHGNAKANAGGFDPVNGVDGAIPNTRNGNTNVECFDCHNSHGSLVAGITSSYVSFNGTKNGGLLKDTTAGRSGYPITYRAQGKNDGINPYSVQAAQCFDCHTTENAGETTPWGYKSTFGATQPIIGYYDSIRFGDGDTGAKKRFSYRNSLTVKGGHLKASSNLSNQPDKQIEGVCSNCHDPHGVSNSFGEDKIYAVPMLKGTWLTSPYKEAVPPTHGPTGGYQLYDSPQNYSNLDTSAIFPNGKADESEDKFAGLCLKCHPKNKLTDGINQNSSWKSVDRVHETVKGWGKNAKHNFICSKCHSPHTSVLPRLMITNCIDYNHRGRVTSGGYPNRGYQGGFPQCHPQDGTWPKSYWNWKTPW